MSRLTFARRAGAIVLAAAGMTCGGGGGGGSNSSPGSPTAPGGTSPSGPSCRTYPTSANVHTTTSGSSVVFDALEAATFDPSTRKATVNTNFANGAPCSTLVTSYNSVADFVDEVRVIPPVALSTGSVSTNSGSCGSVTASSIYTYDSQRRVTQISNNVGGLQAATFEPGRIFTIEPQFRIEEEHLGIRLEDMILITETGVEVLSGDVPIAVADLERTMTSGRP